MRPKAKLPSYPERIELARTKTRKLVDHGIHLIQVHESNQIVAFTDRIGKQVNQTPAAAEGFNLLIDSLFRFEIVRLCVMWDPTRADDIDKESIPAIIQLVDDQTIFSMLEEEARVGYGAQNTRVIYPPEESPTPFIEEQIKDQLDASGRRLAAKDRSKLEIAIRWAKKCCASPLLVSIQNMRDKHIAHSLAQTHRERRQQPIIQLKYRDPTLLLWRTIAILQCLHLGINSASFDWRGSRQIAKEKAEALWGNWKFVTPDPERD